MGIYEDKKNSIEGALFSKVQRQILALFFGRADESFSTNEIIRLVGSGRGAIQRELKKLASSGLLIIQAIGNQKRYQANPNSPIFFELRSIINKTFGLADCIREALKPISKEIQIGFIYGSIAKEEATSQSDIDLMLITEKLSYADIYSLLENVSTQLCRPINPTIYSPAEWIKKLRGKNNFLLKIISQPKIFLIGNENDLAALSKLG